jgi:hypothetical protein
MPKVVHGDPPELDLHGSTQTVCDESVDPAERSNSPAKVPAVPNERVRSNAM